MRIIPQIKHQLCIIVTIIYFTIRLPKHSAIYKHKLDEKEKRLEETDEEREELVKSQKTK